MAASMRQAPLQRPASGHTSCRARLLIARASASQVQTGAKVAVVQSGAFTVQGTVRKVNEDRYDVQVASGAAGQGEPFAFAGVYDGHGGFATADWLTKKLMPIVEETWSSSRPEAALTEAYIQADKQLLSTKSGFMGMGERGVGGSKCGATAVNAVLYNGKEGTMLATANVGDARILLIRGGKPVLLTEEHVPDVESERVRIERQNPNPKQPMVRYVGGTWRVGGLLALSRAFGDAYLKGSLQFEGIATSGDNSYSSGFGVVAEPYTTLTQLTPEDTHLVLASDGLFAEEVRGGGGGLDNETVAELCVSAGSASCDQLAKTMALTAQEVGSTDDVTVVVLKLGSA